MQSVSPVFTDAEVQFEREIAKNQPEYSAIIGLPVTLQIIDEKSGEATLVPDWGISVRFRLSAEEKAQLAAGCDLVVTQLTFGKPFAPMNLQFCPAKTKPVFDLAAQPPRVDPSAADLDLAVKEGTAEVIEFPNQTQQPEPAEDQPQSGV